MQAEAGEKYFRQEDSRAVAPTSLVRRKARIFQTFMTDEELAKRDIAITPNSSANEQSRWFNSGYIKTAYNAPILHAVTLDRHMDFVFPKVPEYEEQIDRSTIFHNLKQRIDHLRRVADEEDVPISDASIAKGLDFLEALDFDIEPSLFLAGNGNLRLSWVNDRSEQIGFQIKPKKDEVQYVIFRLNDENNFEQILGSMSFKSVYPFLQGLGVVAGLLKEPVRKWQTASVLKSKLFAM